MKANFYVKEVEAKFKKASHKRSVKIRSASDAYSLFKDLKDEVQEKFVALHLDGQNQVVCFQVVHVGTSAFAPCNPADILRSTLLTGAVALIVLHNHPSGNTTPSKEDRETTHRIKEAAELLQIRLLDHVIVGDGFHSFADNNQL